MSSRLRRSVRLKLMAVTLASTLAALLFAVAAMVAYDLHLYHKSWLADLRTQASLLGRTTAVALAFDDPRVAQENLELLRHRPKIRAGAIYDARGRLFASFSHAAQDDFPRLPEPDSARVDGDQVVVFQRVANDREILGTVYVRAEYELYERLLGYLGIAVLVTALAVLFGYPFFRWLERAVSGPLLAIAGTAAEVSAMRNFSLRAQKQTQDEIGLLAESFNTMLAEIERATGELEARNAELGREVADRRRAEEEVLRLNAELERRVGERTAQLEYTNAELEAFCYSVSHDLRAPLRAIDGFSQALVDDFARDVPPEGQRYVGRIRAATLRMSQLIEDLLELSKVSRADLQRAPVDMGELARLVVADLRTREPQRQVDVAIWDGMQAHGDPRLLRVALENLIGNAWKFTSRAARPRIEVGALRDKDRAATYFVRDNGAGFDMAYADKLFGAFQRLHGASEFQGTGIGLATVQRIVHRHGGRVWADASPGKGAVFFFTLPSDIPAEAPGGAQPSTQAKVQA